MTKQTRGETGGRCVRHKFIYNGQDDPGLRNHDEQECVLVRELGDDERHPEVGRMFHVCFDDGFEADVFADELVPGVRAAGVRPVHAPSSSESGR